MLKIPQQTQGAQSSYLIYLCISQASHLLSCLIIEHCINVTSHKHLRLFLLVCAAELNIVLSL